MLDVLRFWLDRGVDGFRVDVLWLLIKDAQFRDNPPNPAWQPHQAGIERLLQVHSADQPEVHEVVAAMRAVLDEYGDRVLIGEIYLPLERLVTYYGKEMKGANLPFNFQLIFAAWDARRIAAMVAEYEAALPPGGWPNWVLGNHDQKRIASRVGQAQARVAAMLLLTLRGTPTLYYGDELGLESVPIPPDRAQDPWERREPGLGLGRDPSRTPMPWDASECAGFSTVPPWLPLNDDHRQRNVASMAADPTSLLSLYRALIALRRREPALQIGTYAAVESPDGVLAFTRVDPSGVRLLVALNFSAEPRQVPLPGSTGERLLSTCLDDEAATVTDAVSLRPAEGVIIRLAS
jgi:alpha-glucosidase